MTRHSPMWRRYLTFFERSIRRDLEEELEFHIEARSRELVNAGWSPQAAEEEARRLFGDRDSIFAECERIDTRFEKRKKMLDYLSDVAADVRYTLRGFRRTPGRTAIMVLTLALGIGATTAIFSVVYSVLIKPLPYPNADELVRLRHSARGQPVGTADFDATMYFTYRDENRTFASIGLWQDASATLTDSGEPEQVRALRVTDGTFQALGVQPMRGRWFTEQEHAPSAEGPAVILSHAFWQRRFGGDDGTVAEQLSIDSRPAQVVGIMPPDFRFLDSTPQPDLFIAIRFDPAPLRITGGVDYQALARLKPGVTPAEARADAERLLSIWPEAWPLQPGIGITRELISGFGITPVIRPLKDDVVGGVASMLWVLMGAIGGMLLVACANIANLMLVRADARRQELAVRAALGAVPARIARALLVESLTLGAAGSVLGLVLAYLGLQALVAMGPSNLPRLQEIALHLPVLAFTVVVSLAATLLFGSIPALKAALHVGTPAILGVRGSTASRERGATRNCLVVVQVALALALVVSAALMMRTFEKLRDIDPGFTEAATIQTARIWTPTALASDPEAYTRMQHEMLDKIAALPGVASAGFASTLPMESPPVKPPILIEGQTVADAPTPRGIKFVSPGYFETMGTRIIAGRDIAWSDIETGGRVAVISEDFARELAPEPAGALGKRIRTYAATDAWREVVGVVQSVREAGLYEDAPSFVYWPALVEQMYGTPVRATQFAAFVIRSERAGAATLMNDVRRAVWSVNASVPITAERTMQDLYAGSLARTSFTLVLLAIAGGMALLLGVIGIYGVIAYVVSQRTREIGIRSALGAQPHQVRRMFLRHGLTLCGVGVVVGVVLAAALGRLMSSLLVGVGALDPIAYVAALSATVAAAALASYVPARRAAAIDPVETLRAE